MSFSLVNQAQEILLLSICGIASMGLSTDKEDVELWILVVSPANWIPV